MARVIKEDLYPLMFALLEHHSGRRVVEGLSALEGELAETVQRLERHRFEKPPAEEHRLSDARVKAIVEGLPADPDLALLVLEEGPHARRQASMADRQAEADKEVQRLAGLKTRFFISLAYAIPCVIAANVAMTKYYNMMHAKQAAVVEASFQSTAQELKIHPLQIAAFVLIVIGAWGLAEAWQIANELWIDWTKAKEAVPFVGKAWAERSRKAKDQAEGGSRKPLA